MNELTLIFHRMGLNTRAVLEAAGTKWNFHRYHGMDMRIARIFNTYGPRMRAGGGRVVPNFVGQALRGEDLTVYGDGSQTFQIL